MTTSSRLMAMVLAHSRALAEEWLEAHPNVLQVNSVPEFMTRLVQFVAGKEDEELERALALPFGSLETHLIIWARRHFPSTTPLSMICRAIHKRKPVMTVALGRHGTPHVFAGSDNEGNVHVFYDDMHWINGKQQLKWTHGDIHAIVQSEQPQSWIGVVVEDAVYKCFKDGSIAQWFALERGAGRDVDAAFASKSGATVALATTKCMPNKTLQPAVMMYTPILQGHVVCTTGMRRVCGFVYETPLGVDVVEHKLRVVSFMDFKPGFGPILVQDQPDAAVRALKLGNDMWVYTDSSIRTVLRYTMDETPTMASRTDLVRKDEYVRSIHALDNVEGHVALLLTTYANHPPMDRIVVVNRDLAVVHETDPRLWPSTIAGTMWYFPKDGVVGRMKLEVV